MVKERVGWVGSEYQGTEAGIESMTTRARQEDNEPSGSVVARPRPWRYECQQHSHQTQYKACAFLLRRSALRMPRVVSHHQRWPRDSKQTICAGATQSKSLDSPAQAASLHSTSCQHPLPRVCTASHAPPPSLHHNNTGRAARRAGVRRLPHLS